MSIYIVNAGADALRNDSAFQANCHAAKGLQDVLRTNLGPRGTLKMLVGGAGQIKLTKDGNVLLHEMQIQNATASMIARSSVAQDDQCGDGTTSNVLIIGEILHLCERLIHDHKVHPVVLTEGIELGRQELLKWLQDDSPGNNLKIMLNEAQIDRNILLNVARTALKTKLPSELAENLSSALVDAIEIIKVRDESLNKVSIDLFMIEIIHMKHRLVNDTRLIRGMVLDHGCRNPDMPTSLKNCYILTCNVSLEYEKSEVNSGFFYSSAMQRERLVESEREFTDNKVRKIIHLKRQVCTESNGKTFVVLNQKGIDPPSLDMLAKEGIMALRRVKRRNMERLQLCCGGNAVNSVEDLTENDLGFAMHVYEQTIGEEKYTFVEGVQNPKACCILIKGSSDHSIIQVKDAIRDGLRAVKNVIDDKCVIPGAGAFEIASYCKLQEFKNKISGKKRHGVDLLSNALLVIPRTLARNSGLDTEECIMNLIQHCNKGERCVGLDLVSGKCINPALEGIYDNYCVKRHMLNIAPSLAMQLILVDEILRAGKSMHSST